jgi:hypothetical protein
MKGYSCTRARSSSGSPMTAGRSRCS